MQFIKKANILKGMLGGGVLLLLLYSCWNYTRIKMQKQEMAKDTLFLAKKNNFTFDTKKAINCFPDNSPDVAQLIWNDTTQNEILFNLMFKNKKKEPRIIWIGSWVIAILYSSGEDWLSRTGLGHNKIYITKENKNFNFNTCDTCHWYCHRQTMPFYIYDYCLQNYKILNEGECFQVSMKIKDKKVIDFVKQNKIKVTLFSYTEDIANNQNLGSLAHLLFSEKSSKGWYTANNIIFNFDNKFEWCSKDKVYYGFWKKENKGCSLLEVGNSINQNYEALDVRVFEGF